MSLLDFLFAFIGTLASLTGIVIFMIGIVIFFILPFIPRVTNMFHIFARFHVRLGTLILNRAAVVVSEHGDLLLKRMHPDDVGTEKIYFNDDVKEFEGSEEAKKYWAGIPFAFADEVHGILFRLKDCAIGRRKKEARDRSEMVTKATASERETYEVQGWVKNAFEFPTGKYELVNLNAIRYLITGSERAEHPQRVKEFYRNSRVPYWEKRSATTYIMIIVALLAPFGLMFLIWTQLSGSGNTGSVSYGLLAIIPFLKEQVESVKTRLQAVDWRVAIRNAFRTLGILLYKLLISILVLGPLPAGFYLLWTYTSPTFAVIIYLIIGMGFWFIPILTQLLKVSDRLSTSIADALLKLGLMGYDEPVFVERPQKYEIREWRNLDQAETPIVWHTFLGRKMGFTFEPKPENWGTELADKAKLEAQALADGGAKTNIPSGYKRIPELQRAVYGSLIPSRLKSNCYYIRADIALSRFKHVATGIKSHRRLLQSKEEFGDDNDLSDKSMIIAMTVLGALSLLTGVFVFFILIGV